MKYLKPIRQLPLLLTVLPVLLFTVLQVGAQQSLSVDPAHLATTEEKTEALANRLLALSVATRDRNFAQMAAFFETRIQVAQFPKAVEETVVGQKWIHRHGWQFHHSPQTLSVAKFMEQWRTFLDHFSEIEDVRFKVKESQVQEGAARAIIYFYVVGRNEKNRREWTKGYARVKAHLTKNLWRLHYLKFENLTSKVAGLDLFSEVSVPAGVSSTLPAYGTQRNGDALWSGAAAADVNQDGLMDVFVTGPSENALYMNNGDGSFSDIADQTWTKVLPRAIAPLFLDFDNDGDADLFLSTADSQMLLENRLIPDGLLEFRDISQSARIGLKPAIGFSPIAGDVNRDGFPDIYVPSYNRYGLVMPNSWHKATNGTPNRLYLNSGEGTFEEAAGSWGIADRRWSYAAQFADLDGDGDLDLYVANDYGENGLFLNQGDHFSDASVSSGVLDPGNGMGVSFADYDNDGDLDLHVTNMSSTAGNRILKRLLPKVDPQKDVLAKLAAGNSLFENLGHGHFEDVSKKAGGFSAGWAWGGGFIDFDNDGWEDLYTPNGFISGKSMKDT